MEENRKMHESTCGRFLPDLDEDGEEGTELPVFRRSLGDAVKQKGENHSISQVLFNAVEIKSVTMEK